jgi:predicted transcriptional regulator
LRCKCEVAVHDILPVARALLAKKLVDVYDMSQTEAAKRMGMSQPAISQYKQDIRGIKNVGFKDNARFQGIINDIAKRIANGSVKPGQMPAEMCRLCMTVNTGGMA